MIKILGLLSLLFSIVLSSAFLFLLRFNLLVLFFNNDNIIHQVHCIAGPRRRQDFIEEFARPERVSSNTCFNTFKQ